VPGQDRFSSNGFTQFTGEKLRKQAATDLKKAAANDKPENADGDTVRSERNPRRTGGRWMVRLKTFSRSGIGFVYFALPIIGLHRMNLQHVGRQMTFTEIVMQNRKNQPQNPTPWFRSRIP
jgi:hypothetical protein